MQRISTNDKELLCQHYLTGLYHKAQRHPTLRSISETYGEILSSGVNKLLSLITLSKDDVFVDLGSGLGKVVVQVFLQSDVKEARGLEIIPELHNQALLIKEQVQHALPEFFTHERTLNFSLDNFLIHPLMDASVLLIGSICFPPSMLFQISKIINSMDTIHTVFSLRPLSHLKNLAFKRTVRVECSWDTALGYLYVKKS